MNIKLTLTLSAAAAALAGCQRDTDVYASYDTAICADRGKRVPDSSCGSRVGGGGGGWYYVGRGSRVPYYDEPVSGGSYNRTAGASYFRAPVESAMTRSAAASRGGFGSSARSFGHGIGE